MAALHPLEFACGLPPTCLSLRCARTCTIV